MSNEIVLAKSWIFQRITGDATLQGLGVVPGEVWENQAPDGATGRQIVFQRLESTDIRGIGVRFMSRLRYLIRVVDLATDWTHDPIVNRIDALFDQVGAESMSDPVGTIESCIRVEPYDLPETVDGVQYRHLGGIYQIEAVAGA